MLNPFFNKNENRIRAGWRLAGQFFLAITIALLLTSLLGIFIPQNHSLIFGVSMLAGALFSTRAAGKGLDNRSWSEYGIRLDKNWLKECLTGFAIAAIAVSVIFIIEYLAGWLTIRSYGFQTGATGSYLWPFISYFLLMICVGFYEELIFRSYQIINLAEGFNFPSVSRRQATAYAVIFSSVLFGVLHLSNPNATALSTFNIAVAGLMLAFPFLVTGRLSFSTGLHIGWNFFLGGIFGFAVSGLRNDASLILIDQTGPGWLTGGQFGPEAGLLGLLGMLSVVGMLILIFKIKEQSIALAKRFGKYKSPE